MTWGAPLWLWALALLPLLAVLFGLGEVRRRRLLGQFVAARLQPALASGVSVMKRRLRFALLLAGLACLIVALAQPRRGYVIIEQKSVGRDLIVAIDVSRSMLANDLSPTRLARAKLATEDLLRKLKGDRVGLVAFAGSAFLQAPLTVDYSAVLNALRDLDTNTIPLGGTNLAEAIRVSADAFGKGEGDERAMIIVTDGEELDDDALAEAKKAAGTMRIFTVGVGSAEGTIIAIPGRRGETEYLKGPDGQIVKSKLDEPRLRAIAEAAHGFYVHLQSGPAEMEIIIRDGLEAMKSHEAEALVQRRPLERYRWPLAAGMLLCGLSLLPGERKRVALAALLALAWSSTGTLQARNDGVEAYERKDYPAAAESFQKQLEKRPDFAPLYFDHGTAAYQSGDYDKALDSFSHALTTPKPALREQAEYNIGNTLFQRGAAQKGKPEKLKDWKNAVQHFDQALSVDPKDGDAKYNRDLVQRMIDDLEKEQKKDDQKKPDEQKKKDQDKKDQDKKDQKDKGQNKPDKGDQKDQGNKGDQKDQQKQGGQGDQKDQPGKPGEQKGEGEKKPGEGQQGDAKDQPGEQGDQKGDQKDGPGKPPGDQKGQEGEQPPNHQADGSKGEPKDQDGQAKNQPAKPDRDLKGDIKPTEKGEQQQQEAQAQQQAKEAAERDAKEEAAAAAGNRMTATQAASLLDSLRNADQKVQLLEPPTGQPTNRLVRDW